MTTAQVHDRLYIDGEWVEPSTAATITVRSPATGEIVGSVPEGARADIDRAVAAARRVADSGSWAALSPAERAVYLDRAADLLEARAEEVARLITAEMGSTITFSRTAQVPTPVGNLRYHAELGRTFGFVEERATDVRRTLIRKEPVGVVAAIIPWNVPLMMSVGKVAPALVAGCPVILKPSPEAPLDSFVLAEIFHEIGLPAGVFNLVPADREVSEHLVAHPDVDKITFTGSTPAGRRIASVAGERLARVNLELGGKSGAVVLDDAPVEPTVAKLVSMAFILNGQACMAQTRVIVPKARRAEYAEAFTAEIAALTVGDPMDEATFIGPLVAERQLHRVESYIASGLEEGAQVTVGGKRPADLDRGWYIEPTLFDGVTNSMRIFREEIFGPVLCLSEYDDEDQAVALANDTEYGLSGSVWTADVDHGLDVAARLRTGGVSINGAANAQGAPFGGMKSSGIGREQGPEGLSQFLELKSVALPRLTYDPPAAVIDPPLLEETF